MIFVILGSQKFQFNRLLKWIDELIDEETITNEVFSQVGWSDYVPRNYVASDFLEREDFIRKVNEASIIITHAGTGAIVTALKNNKKVVAIPRDYIFGEHVDNHQMQIVKKFSDQNLILAANNKEELRDRILNIPNWKPNEFISSNHEYKKRLISYINSF